MQNSRQFEIRTFFPWRSFASFAVMLCLLLAGCAGEPKHATWVNSTGSEQHERLMWKAVQEKDWANFEHHLSATFVGVNAEGKLFDRAGWLEQWKNAPVQDFSVGEIQVQPERTGHEGDLHFATTGIGNCVGWMAGGFHLAAVQKGMGAFRHFYYANSKSLIQSH